MIKAKTVIRRSLILLALLALLHIAYYLINPEIDTNWPALTYRPEIISSAIPKVIWSYWHQEPIPELVLQAVSGWKRTNPGYEVNVLSGTSLGEYIPLHAIPGNFQAASPTFQADWIRLYLMANHGGFWLDASICLTGPLEFIHEKQQTEHTEGFMYTLVAFTTIRRYPVYDPWLMAAVPDSQLYRAWFTEFDRLFARGGLSGPYVRGLRSRLGREVYARLVQNNDAPEYLSVTIAGQKVIQVDGFPGLSTLSAADGPYYLQTLYSWDEEVYAQRMFQPYNHKVPIVLKMRWNERDAVMRLLSNGGVRGWFGSFKPLVIDPESIYARFFLD